MLNLSSALVRQNVMRYLWDETKRSGDDNIQAFGFGAGLKDNQVDASRPFCLRAYVKKKHRGRSGARPKFKLSDSISLPVQVELQNPRQATDTSKNGLELRIPTDVYEVGELVGSSHFALLEDEEDSRVTTGIIVRWRISNSLTPSWGVLTVAHGYEAPIDPAERPDVSIVDPETQAELHGERIEEFRAATSGVDLCLIQVRPELLMRAGLITSIAAPRLHVQSFDDLTGTGVTVGTVRQAGNRAFGFTVVGTVDSEKFEGVGKVINLIHVQSSDNVFSPGTSGSPFMVADALAGTLNPAAIQIGADPNTFFRDGYGQSLETSLTLLELRLNERLIPVGKHLLDGIEVVRVF